MQHFVVLAALVAAASAQLCSNPGQLVPNPMNCKEFFMCRSGRTILFSCPENTLFNPRTLACDMTNRVHCEWGTLPDNVINSAIKANPSQIEHTVTACINQPIAMLLPNVQDCQRFYQCSATGAIAFQCPHGTNFDAWRKTCLEAGDAICGTVSQPNPPLVPPVIVPPIVMPPVLPPVILPPAILPPTLPVVPPTNNQNSLQMLCRGKPLGAMIRNPSNCREFVRCVGTNQLRLTECPVGTAFDDVRNVCDWSQNVKC